MLLGGRWMHQERPDEEKKKRIQTAPRGRSRANAGYPLYLNFAV